MSSPQDYFDYKNNVLTVGGISIPQLTEKYGTPLYVYSADAFLNPLRQFQKYLAPVDPLICFAVKSNSNIAILKMLGDAGAGMDLVSGGELFRAGSAEISPKKIVFSGVGKTAEEMSQALQFKGEGIFSFNVESMEELFLLNKVATHFKRRAQVALRFNPDVDPKTHPYISTGLKKNKFGINRVELLKIAKNVKNLPAISIQGLSIHIGSQLLSLSPLNDSFLRVKTLLTELENILPEPISYLDLGGGVGITYLKEKPPTIKAYCELILKHFGPKSKLKRTLKILIEPGRVLSGNSGVLVSQVLYRKERVEKDFLVVDAAMNDLMRPALYESYHEVVPVKKSSLRRKKTDVVGPVCETGDWLARDRMLSQNLRHGDLIAILSSGAYGFTMASNYNSRPRPAEILVHDGQAHLIRKRENLEDLIRGESVL